MSVLSAAAVGHPPRDPFGLLNSQSGTPSASPYTQRAATSRGEGGPGAGYTPPPPTVPQNGGGTNTGSNGSTPPTNTGQTAPAAQPPPAPQYDVSTDPILQIVNAQLALADSNAQAAALQARQQALLAYGDPNLAAQVLGQSDPLVQAAGQNQESTLSLLARASGQSLHNFENTLDPSLTFSGFRVGQEGLLGQAYQDSLARAAADIQDRLSGITSGLNTTLENDSTARANALADAYNRAIQAALLNPPAPPKTPRPPRPPQRGRR